MTFAELHLSALDLPLLASTFLTVFLAELGDKTQLAIVTISGTSNRPGAVFAGSSAALVFASLLGAAAGGSLSAVIPTNALQLAASLGFLVIGIRLIQRSTPNSEDGVDGSGDGHSDGTGDESVQGSGDESGENGH